MPETPTSPWPEDFFDFAFVPATDDKLTLLTTLAESEDWTYQHAVSEHPYPILFNYVRYTYHRVAEENKIALSEDGQFSCFNTGLVTPAIPDSNPGQGDLQARASGSSRRHF
jgi:hypothetical protein